MDCPTGNRKMAGLIRVTTRPQFQEINCVWKIEDLGFLSKLRRVNEISFEFETGEKIGMGSKWKVSLVVGKPPEQEIKLYFELIDDGGKPDTPFYAWARISLDKPKKKDHSDDADRVGEDEEMVQFIKLDNDDGEDEEVAHLDLVEEEGGVGDDLVDELVFELKLHDFNGVKVAAECGSYVTASDLINNYLDKEHSTFILLIQFGLYGSAVSTVQDSHLRVLIDSVKEECSSIHKKVMLTITVLKEGENADVIFKTKDGQAIKAHKIILSAHSAVLKAMLDSEMKENGGVVELPDIGSDGLKIFLKYLYTGDVDEKWRDYYEELINAADKYMVHPLKQAYDQLLITICTKDNCCELMELSSLHNLSIAKGEIEKFISNDPTLVMKLSRINHKKVMLTMLKEGENADVIFKTKDGQEIKAHKNILSAHSAVLKAMLDSEMKKNGGVVELPDIGSDGLKIFLKYLYTGDVDEKWCDFCEELINAADKYQVQPLKDACDLLLITICTKDNCCELIQLANLHNLPFALGNIKKLISDDPALLMKFASIMFQKKRN